MRLRVLELAGENAVTAEGGAALYAALINVVQRHEVVVDFEGVRVFASPFFNGSIGRLVGEVASDVLKRNLTLENLSPTGEDLARRVIQNSREYHARTEAQRRSFDAVVGTVPSER